MQWIINQITAKCKRLDNSASTYLETMTTLIIMKMFAYTYILLHDKAHYKPKKNG